MACHSKSRSDRFDKPKLAMTPMIDVVFLLLIFFIIVIRPEELLAKLDISDKAHDPDIDEPIIPTLHVDVKHDHYAVGGRAMSLDQIEYTAGRMRRTSENTAVLIRCDGDAEHGRLVTLLDMCAKHKITNVTLIK